MNDDATTRDLLQKGRLSQACPADCSSGWRASHPGMEAAGRHCSAFGAPTGPACWVRGEMPEAQRDALTRSRAARKQEGAIPEVLA